LNNEEKGGQRFPLQLHIKLKRIGGVGESAVSGDHLWLGYGPKVIATKKHLPLTEPHFSKW
jgi:hypothetical protein